MKGIIGKKLGMTQTFTENGEVIPVTVVQATPNVVLQVKTQENDGYSGIQIGNEDKKEQRTNSAEKGHAKKANTTAKKNVKEIRLNEELIANYNIGDEIKVDAFEAGEVVDVQGTSKGKGFQGVIKRHNQARGPQSHGHRFGRRPGSMGAIAPAVFKTKKLPGQMGNVTKTIQNLEIVSVDVENNLLLVKGNIPGPKKGIVFVKSAIKKNKSTSKREAKTLINYNKVEEAAQTEEN